MTGERNRELSKGIDQSVKSISLLDTPPILYENLQGLVTEETSCCLEGGTESEEPACRFNADKPST